MWAVSLSKPLFNGIFADLACTSSQRAKPVYFLINQLKTGFDNQTQAIHKKLKASSIIATLFNSLVRPFV